MLLAGLLGGTAMLAWLLSTLGMPIDLSQPPVESRRYYDRSGFSIIVPEGMKVTSDEDQMTLLPASGRARYSPTLSVRLMSQSEGDTYVAKGGFARGVFQGRDMWVSRESAGKYDAWRVIIQRELDWFEISLLLPGYDADRIMPPPEWMPYLESFKATGRPATRPYVSP